LLVLCVAALAKVVRAAEAMVAELPKEKAAPAMPGGGVGGMDF
jgi:chaperonin GroEL